MITEKNSYKWVLMPKMFIPLGGKTLDVRPEFTSPPLDINCSSHECLLEVPSRKEFQL